MRSNPTTSYKFAPSVGDKHQFQFKQILMDCSRLTALPRLSYINVETYIILINKQTQAGIFVWPQLKKKLVGQHTTTLYWSNELIYSHKCGRTALLMLYCWWSEQISCIGNAINSEAAPTKSEWYVNFPPGIPVQIPLTDRNFLFGTTLYASR